MKKALFFAAIVVLFTGADLRPAAAAYVTGSELAGFCGGAEPKQVFNCLGYIGGVIDYHIMMQSLGTSPTTDFCLPENLTQEEASFVVLTYLKKSPQYDSFIAAPAVAAALHEAFPCGPPVSKKKKKNG